MSSDDRDRDSGIVYTFYPDRGVWQAGRPEPEPPPGRRSRASAVLVIAGLVMGAALAGGVLRDQQWKDVPRTMTLSTRLAGAPSSPDDAGRPDLVSVIVAERVAGSGVVYDSGGLVLTTTQVVKDASGEVTIRLGDGTTTAARVVATDATSGIVVLRPAAPEVC
ncbi:trypsin-like peptidase domain-containing protein [Nonomuraea typhae]|uniref:trypsin-like peptidase domain-containing protein n=1 Tax=Nonomuraea typhae TaxID=2603600 RepID=UPI0012FCC9C9|nr:trypsin-like peptidase domain-containing protein [Nonomuraea typhae]